MPEALEPARRREDAPRPARCPSTRRCRRSSQGRMGAGPDISPASRRTSPRSRAGRRCRARCRAMMPPPPDAATRARPPRPPPAMRCARDGHGLSRRGTDGGAAESEGQPCDPAHLAPRCTRPPTRPCACAAVTLASCLAASTTRARRRGRQETPAMPNTPAPELAGVDIVEHLGGALPRDAAFRDTEGNAVRLGDFFDGKRPTLLVFAYHTCPMLCSLVLDATVRSLNDVAWTVGDEFDVVSISIDPRDTPETATRKRAQVVASYTRAKGDTRGLALPRRRRGEHPQGHRRHRLPVPLRRAPEAVRAPRRHLPPHARRADRALPLRHPVRPERRAPRPARGHRGALDHDDRAASSSTATTTTRRASTTPSSR